MKKLTSILAVAALALCLTACGGKKEAVTVDSAKLATELLTTVTSDTLSETAAAMVPAFYGLDEASVASSVAYASAGATACEVAVIESKEEKNTSAVEEKLKTYVKNQSDLYASYNQTEVGKLEKTVIKSAGVYTVFVVGDDAAKAEEILKGYGF